MSKIGEHEVNSVSARELYLDLGMSEAVWSRWAKSNIEENQFFLQGVDFIALNNVLSDKTKGNFAQDYAVTIEFAKHIAMMAKTQRAHDYRNYFIECEKKAHEKTAQIEPPTKSKPLLIIPPQQNPKTPANNCPIWRV